MYFDEKTLILLHFKKKNPQINTTTIYSEEWRLEDIAKTQLTQQHFWRA